MEDLDIYGDLDNFDAKVELDKNLTELNELRVKYEQLLKEKDLLAKRNIKLEEDMKSIKVNFRSLMETARAEVDRKDMQIQELRKERDNVAFRRDKHNKGPPPFSRPEKVGSTCQSTLPAPAPDPQKTTIESRGPASRETERPSRSDSARREMRDVPRKRSRDRERSRDKNRKGSRDRERSRDRKRQCSSDRHKPSSSSSSRRSRERSRSRDKNRSRRSRDRSRNRRRGQKDRSRDRAVRAAKDSDSSQKRRNETESTSKSSTPSSISSSCPRNCENPSKRPRIDKEAPVVTADTQIKSEVEGSDSVEKKPEAPAETGPPSPQPTPTELIREEPSTEERHAVPLVTSFTGSLERLKREGVLINAERQPTIAASPLVDPFPESAMDVDVGILEPEPVQNQPTTSNHSEELLENALQISAEIKSSPATVASTSPLVSFEVPKSSLNSSFVSPSSTTLPFQQTMNFADTTEITPLPPLNVHPHMNLMPAKDHLPMMVIPREAVLEPEVPEVAAEPPLLEKAEPLPPRPKIQMVAGNREPYVKKEEAEQPPSSLTVENLERVNKEQERNHLEYLRAEILQVAGPIVANDPQLQESFRRKEREAARRAQKQTEKLAEAAPSVASTNMNGDMAAVKGQNEKTPQGGEKQSVPPAASSDKNQKENAVSADQPATKGATEKCIIMGHSKYNYTEDSEGNKVMVVSRLKKKKGKPLPKTQQD